jgi:hypothetical protein
VSELRTTERVWFVSGKEGGYVSVRPGEASLGRLVEWTFAGRRNVEDSGLTFNDNVTHVTSGTGYQGKTALTSVGVFGLLSHPFRRESGFTESTSCKYKPNVPITFRSLLLWTTPDGPVPEEGLWVHARQNLKTFLVWESG